MHLVLLGTGGYHPSDTRQTACLMIPSLGVILDAGTALYRVRKHLQTDELQIFISHAHLDHIVGLTYLLSVLHERASRKVTIYGERSKLAAIEEHLFATDVFPVKVPMEQCALEETAVQLPAGGVLRHFPLKHPGGSLGFRLDWEGRSLAYVTDTTAHSDADYIEHIRGVDVLVHECYFPDALEEMAELTGHSCITPVAQVARAAGVGRLVLTHINPLEAMGAPIELAVAQRVFPRTLLGHDGMVVDF